MSEELERLRADLEAVNNIRIRYQSDIKLSEIRDDLYDKIARLEAEEADPWREAKEAIEYWSDNAGYSALWAREAKVIAYVNHLTAENDRLAARVAELEDAKYFRLDPETGMLEVDHVGPDPILDPARLLATAFDIIGGHVKFDAKPYRLKGASE